MSQTRYPSRTFTVVIRDVAPRAILDEPVAHRSVSIQLTDEQLSKLALRKTGTSCGTELYEEVSFVFFDSKELTVAFVENGEESP